MYDGFLSLPNFPSSFLLLFRFFFFLFSHSSISYYFFFSHLSLLSTLPPHPISHHLRVDRRHKATEIALGLPLTFPAAAELHGMAAILGRQITLVWRGAQRTARRHYQWSRESGGGGTEEGKGREMERRRWRKRIEGEREKGGKLRGESKERGSERRK